MDAQTLKKKLAKREEITHADLASLLPPDCDGLLMQLEKKVANMRETACLVLVSAFYDQREALQTMLRHIPGTRSTVYGHKFYVRQKRAHERRKSGNYPASLEGLACEFDESETYRGTAGKHGPGPYTITNHGNHPRQNRYS